MTPNAIATLPEQDDESVKALAWVKGFEVQTADDYTMLDKFCVAAKEREQKGESLFRSEIEAAHALHKGLLAKLKGYVNPAIEFRAVAKQKMAAWQEKQKALAAIEEARLRAEAQKKAEDEALARAEAAAEFGDDKMADAIISAPVVIEPVKVGPATPKTQTIFQTRWKFKIKNAALIPREYLIPDETKIGGVIRSTKGAITIPGVEAYQEKC